MYLLQERWTIRNLRTGQYWTKADGWGAYEKVRYFTWEEACNMIDNVLFIPGNYTMDKVYQKLPITKPVTNQQLI